MNRIFTNSRVFLVGGPGGVGKTTLAASLGVGLAEQGYKTVVLTVDPARRLAQALGFENFSKDLQQVPLQTKKGELHASMLDSRRYFDRIIERFAKTPEQRDRIFANPIYQVMVDSLGGSHEYAAMERLLEFAQDPQWEKIVVDTPPTHNALDLIAAPRRLANFMDSSVISWFQGGGALYLRMFRTGTKIAMKALQTIFGSEFLDTLGKFLTDLEGMQEGFQNRHRAVLEMLKSPESKFFLTTFPSEARFRDSQILLQGLATEKIELSAVFVNRAFVDPGALEELTADTPENLRSELQTLWHLEKGLWESQQGWIEKFRTLRCPLFRVIPQRSNPVHDVVSLSELGTLLIS